MTKYVPTFSIVPKEVIGQYFKLPQNTPFWSIALQLTIKTSQDIIVKITNTTIHDNTVFGIMQNSFLNVYPLEGHSYYDRANGEIHINFVDLIPL